MAFFGGSTGVIYRQFSVTIVSAMALSVLVALILSPALTSTLLKPKNGDNAADSRFPRVHAFLERAKTGFNTRFDGAVDRYVGSVTKVRSEEHTSELQSLMRSSYAVFCLKKKKKDRHLKRKLHTSK